MSLRHLTSYEFFRWSEFQALLKRIGIEGEKTNYLRITIGPDSDCPVSIEHTYLAQDSSGKMNTTTLVNERYTTCVPCPSNNKEVQK